jgi:hypothetical protein
MNARSPVLPTALVGLVPRKAKRDACCAETSSFPGMLGTRCAEADHCLLGAGVDVGVEFKICSVPCKADAACKPLDTKSDADHCGNGFCVTLPHGCLGAEHEGGRCPTTFGVPCTAQVDRRGDLECLEAAGDPRSPENDFATHVRTISCTQDSDCDADAWTKSLGFCRDGSCRQAGGDGAPRERPAHWSSDRCDAGTKKCIPPLSGPVPS